MKLLIIYHAGLTEDAKAIFREYVRQGVDLTVIVPSKFYSPTGRCFSYSEEDNEKTYRFIPIKFKAGFDFFRLFQAIKQTKPDVIHVLDEYSSIYLAQTIFCRNVLYKKKVPVFAYAFQNIPFISPPFIFECSLKFFKRIIYKILYPLIFWYHCNNVNGVAGCSNEALLNVKSFNPNVPVKLIFWGIGVDKFFPKDRDACREKLGISKDVKLLGYVGRIAEEKGIDKLIEAVNKMEGYYLMIIGDGEYKNKLDKKIDLLKVRGRIYWRGFIGNGALSDYYNAFDVFILPTQTTPGNKEQYGRVLVEAMACKSAIVGSSCGAIPDVLSGYPKHLIFEEDSVEDLADKIQEAGKMQFPENFTLEKFLYKFSVENFVKENVKFYESIF